MPIQPFRTHTVLYLIARGSVGALSVVALTLYTRLLGAENFGRYGLIVSLATAISMTGFQWINLGILRFTPSYTTHNLYNVAWLAYIVIATVATLLALIVGPRMLPVSLHFMLLPGLLLVLLQSWFDLNLDLIRGSLDPSRYSWLTVLRAILANTLGITFVLWGFGAAGPVWGLILGMLVVGLWAPMKPRPIRSLLTHVDYRLLWKLASYGLPISTALATGIIVSTTDRLLLTLHHGFESTGAYSAAYDLVQRTVGMLISTANLGAYAIIIWTYEQQGDVAARRQLAKNGIMLLALVLPVVVCLVMQPKLLATWLLSSELSGPSEALLPVLAIAVLVSFFRSNVIDVPFHLEGRIVGQLAVSFLAITTNMILDAFWIPTYGAIGAASATLCAYLLALAVGIIMQARWLDLREWLPEVGKLTVAVGIMILVLLTMPGRLTLRFSSLMRPLCAAIAYFLAALALDLSGMRKWLLCFRVGVSRTTRQ